MITHPFIDTTPNSPTVKFRDSPEVVDLDKELPRILHQQGWGCGTIFTVQFVNHKMDKLIKMATFVVSEDTETLSTNNDNPYQPMTRTTNARKAQMVGRWWPEAPEPADEGIEGFSHLESETITTFDDADIGGVFTTDTPVELFVRWNPGKKEHEVLQGDVVIFHSPEKSYATRYRDGFDPVTGEPRR